MTESHEESRVRVDLTAVVVAVRAGDPVVLTVSRSADAPVALPSGPLESAHRTLQAGLRNWVEIETGFRLGYVEQLYTFGDPAPSKFEHSGPDADRALSIAYLALVSPPGPALPHQGDWRSWYAFFPWEDMRAGEPAAREPLLDRLTKWAARSGVAGDREVADRIRLAFAGNGAPWDEERTLERYEMLYEAGLVPEAFIDRGDASPAGSTVPGLAMHADHRRMLATAISRLRAKIKYRPVLFELMPPAFTLSELQRTAEALSGIVLHKQNFRRLIAQQDLVEETGEVATDTGGRPAKLMRFRREATLERPAPGVRLSATRRAGFP
ncbi:NUDIX hydrolase [Amorphus coralli]|uniref:NUDIX hydrolase n=1 Tax=Amorphus coralli TaxID=340680 RepID=UPI000366CA7C|nr:hypothetical protein [Amorphus coralli]